MEHYVNQRIAAHARHDFYSRVFNLVKLKTIPEGKKAARCSFQARLVRYSTPFIGGLEVMWLL